MTMALAPHYLRMCSICLLWGVVVHKLIANNKTRPTSVNIILTTHENNSCLPSKVGSIHVLGVNTWIVNLVIAVHSLTLIHIRPVAMEV